jgi:hypothetical protein
LILTFGRLCFYGGIGHFEILFFLVGRLSDLWFSWEDGRGERKD